MENRCDDAHHHSAARDRADHSDLSNCDRSRGGGRVDEGAAAMTVSYRDSAKFKASRARTAKRRYWRDPEKARQRLRDYRAHRRAAHYTSTKNGLD